MHEPTVEPTATTVEPDGSEGEAIGVSRYTLQDSGSEGFYGALFGAILGMIAGGVFGLMTGNAGLKQIDDAVIFMSAVTVAAVVFGMVCSEAWGAVIGAVTRSAAATHGASMFIVAIIGSAAAAVLLMLVAQPLAGPIALLSIGLITAYCVIVLIMGGIKMVRRRD